MLNAFTVPSVSAPPAGPVIAKELLIATDPHTSGLV
jgi:hypothetical protein